MASIRRRQLDDGGWNIYEGGPSEVNADGESVLRAEAGRASRRMTRGCARRAPACCAWAASRTMNTYAKLYLALLGQFPWQFLPTIPVEIVFFPNWCFFNLYEMSSWSRAMLIPLAILNHHKPTRALPAEMHLHELYPAGSEQQFLGEHKDRRFWSWRELFPALRQDAEAARPAAVEAVAPGGAGPRRSVDGGAHGRGERRPGRDLPGDAELADRAARRSDYPADHPLYVKAKRDFEGLMVDDPQDFRIQPCLSPVWDTAINTIALGESGLSPDHPALRARRGVAGEQGSDEPARRLARTRIRTPRRAAGPSSSTTSTTRIRTTP